MLVEAVRAALAAEGDPARFAAQEWDIAGHVFESAACRARELHDEISAGFDDEVFVEVLSQVPDVWLEPVPGAETPAELRAAYVSFLSARLTGDAWLPGGAG